MSTSHSKQHKIQQNFVEPVENHGLSKYGVPTKNCHFPKKLFPRPDFISMKNEPFQKEAFGTSRCTLQMGSTVFNINNYNLDCVSKRWLIPDCTSCAQNRINNLNQT